MSNFNNMQVKVEKRLLNKLPAKYAVWILPLILSFLMSGTLSLVNLAMRVDFVSGFTKVWLKTWMFSWLIAYPLILVLLPVVRRLTGLIVDMQPKP